MRNIILTIAIVLFIIGVTLQFICTMHIVSIQCFGLSALLLMLIKEKNMKKETEKCNGTCEHCVCKNQQDEQHNKT